LEYKIEIPEIIKNLFNGINSIINRLNLFMAYANVLDFCLLNITKPGELNFFTSLHGRGTLPDAQLIAAV